MEGLHMPAVSSTMRQAVVKRRGQWRQTESSQGPGYWGFLSWWRGDPQPSSTTLAPESVHVGFASAAHVAPGCTGHPVVLSTMAHSPLSLWLLCFSLSSRSFVGPPCGAAGSFRAPGWWGNPLPPSHHQWESTTSLATSGWLVFLKVYNIKVNPTEKTVLMVTKALIQTYTEKKPIYQAASE